MFDLEKTDVHHMTGIFVKNTNRRKKYKIVSGIILTAFLSVCWNFFSRHEINSPCDSPLVGDHSGAPGETDCTGCHSGNPNTGSGILEFNVSNDSIYVPGQTYACKVRITQAGLNKFGFVNAALKNSNNTTTGSFNIIDTFRTRKFSMGGRNYFSHTPCGADADTTGMIEWNYFWTAPPSDAGNITLYISALAANHDHTLSGDFTYTKSIVLSPSVAGLGDDARKISGLLVYPVPASGYLVLSYMNSGNAETEIALYDVQGRKISVLYSGRISTGAVSKSFSLDNLKIPSGVYFLRISTENFSVYRKIIANP